MKKKVAIPVIFFAILGIVLMVFIIWSILEEKIIDDKYDRETKEMLTGIKFDIPEEFEKNSSGSYSYYKDGNSCYFDISSSEKFDDTLEKWFKARIIVNLNDEVGELEEKEINGNKVYAVQIKDKYGFANHYGFETDNYYHFITFRISDYTNGEELDRESNPCYGFENRIISSLKF
jgi:hypothetical protein